MIRARRAAVALLVLAFAGAAHSADPVGELETLRRAIEEHRERVTGFEREERGLLETLEAMDRAAQALARDADRARREARAARERSARLEREAGVLEQRLTQTRRALSRRAVALYKSGDVGPVRALFGAASLPEALARLRGLRRLVDHDQALLDRQREQATALVAARAGAEEAARARDAAAARLARRERELERERGGRRALLARVRQDRGSARSALVELEAAARALEETLARLEETAPRSAAVTSVPFVALRGRLPPPVEAPVSGAFGRVVDAQFGTEIFRKGIEFEAPAGTPVRAVAEGEVRFTGWFRGYGKIVILDHGSGYYSVSGHLDAIGVEPGDRLRGGDAVGSVGETGSLTGPKLYFELRQQGEAIDPGDWILGAPRG